MLRRFTRIAVVLLACVACTRPANQDYVAVDSASVQPVGPPGNTQLTLRLDYTSGEHSKDSHAKRYTCTIEAGRVLYAGPHGECVRGQCEHEEVTFAISPTQAESLLGEIEQLELFAEFVENKRTNLTGHYHQLSLNVTDGQRKGAIRVSGMRKARAPDDSQNLSDEAKRWVGAAEKLQRKLVALVRPHLPDVR